MVGFDPKSQIELSSFEHGAAGVLSGIVTRAVVQPLDVVKIRFQLQVDPIQRQSGSKYHGVLQAARLIVREEGVKSLWKGHIPAQGLSIIFGLVQFGSYEYLTKTAWFYLPEKLTRDWQPINNFICGATAGTLAMTTALPMDVLRTRLIAQGEPKSYFGMWHAIRTMFRTEGVLSFYRGFVPTVVQTAPYTGLQFAFYVGSVHIWNSVISRASTEDAAKIGALESLMCGGVAGMGSKMAVYPLDMLKKRLQIIGFEKARQSFGTVHSYRGLVHCIGLILKHEGVTGVYKGLFPSLIKAAAASGVGFLSYEQACRLLKTYHTPQTPPR